MNRYHQYLRLALLPALLLLPSYSLAATYVYDLHGTSSIALRFSESLHINWDTATLTYDDIAQTLEFGGTVLQCTGLGGSCYDGLELLDPATPRNGDENFSGFVQRKNDISGVGLADLYGSFLIDPEHTTGPSAIYADAQWAGTIRLHDKYSHFPSPRRNPIKYSHIRLKEDEELGWAFRLVEDSTLPDGSFRIESWMVISTWLHQGPVRAESRPGELQFNGDIIAKLRNFTPSEPPQVPPTEIPEPMSLSLLISGLLGLGCMKRNIC